MDLVITGGNGRVGLAIRKLVESDEDVSLISCITKETANPADAIELADIVIDFSTPKAALEYLKICQKFNKPIVIGTTGFSDSDIQQIKNISNDTIVFMSSNMSFGVAVMNHMLSIASKMLLDNSFEASILDVHHKHKKDAPSGTAIAMRDAIKQSADNFHVDIASIRRGEVIGEHEVCFSSKFEELTISHMAFDRCIYADGAIKAVKWILSHKPQAGRIYSMKDMIINGFKNV